MIQNKKDEAIAVYERILKLSPEHPIALNNLANIFSTRDPSLALRYAKRAYQRAPGDVAVMDTYGWLLLKTGDSKQALGLLRTAFAAAPYATEVHFHLAAAMVENGEKAQARKELEKLLSNQREFPVKQDAQALLSTL